LLPGVETHTLYLGDWMNGETEIIFIDSSGTELGIWEAIRVRPTLMGLYQAMFVAFEVPKAGRRWQI